jgi:hypothetical protein
MRIRTIKPDFFLHEDIHAAENEAKLPLRLAFIGLWCAADREGRFKWEPRKLGVQIMPYDKIDFSRVLDALTTRGFIEKHTSSTCEFGFIPSFHRHQIVNNREKRSELPTPCESSLTQGLTRASRDTEVAKISLSGREGKGREQEGKGKEQGASSTHQVVLPFSSPEFIQLWEKWNEHLIAKKKKPTDSTIEFQLKNLEEMGEQRAIHALAHSIAGGYQGIFEPTPGKGNQPGFKFAATTEEQHKNGF